MGRAMAFTLQHWVRGELRGERWFDSPKVSYTFLLADGRCECHMLAGLRACWRVGGRARAGTGGRAGAMLPCCHAAMLPCSGAEQLNWWVPAGAVEPKGIDPLDGSAAGSSIAAGSITANGTAAAPIDDNSSPSVVLPIAAVVAGVAALLVLAAGLLVCWRRAQPSAPAEEAKVSWHCGQECLHAPADDLLAP
jgi:hypothetical protein